MKFKIFLWDIIKFMHLGPLMLYIHPKSELKKQGWFKSFHNKSVIDKNGNSIPWWTYSCIDFIEERLNRNIRVLEFGCGGSTVWLSYRVKEVLSIETDPNWAAKTRKKINSSAKIVYVNNISDSELYTNFIEGKYDILIIDNEGNRMECAINNLQHLNDNGVILWDNTDGNDWKEIKEFFFNKGFKEISFTGMIPQELCSNRTTLFYKEKNVFCI